MQRLSWVVWAKSRDLYTRSNVVGLNLGVAEQGAGEQGAGIMDVRNKINDRAD